MRPNPESPAAIRADGPGDHAGLTMLLVPADAPGLRISGIESSMVKLKTTEVARQVALAGMQMMGGYGYATEYDRERHVRATLVSTIGKTYGL